MMMYGGVNEKLHSLLSWGQDGDDWSDSPPGETTRCSHWLGGWVGREDILDAAAKKKNP